MNKGFDFTPLFLIIAWFGISIFAGVIAARKNRSFLAYFSLGAFLFPPLSLLVAWLMKAVEPRQMYCKNCGTTAVPKRIMKGSVLIELFLWLLFLLPGLIYSIWRHTSVYQGCPSCIAGSMIPLNSPLARAALRKEG